MKTLPSFIREELEEIVAEWEAFAATLGPAAGAMDSLALRDHAKPMLQAIAKDIETSQSDMEQASKSKGLEPSALHETAATIHGILRQTAGFDLRQLVAEFRALRATVLRLWLTKYSEGNSRAYDITRFNEGIDQALAESVESYSSELAKSRDTFLAILGHDLRSPLGAMAGALHILSQPASESQHIAAAAAGKRSVAAMDGMIRDLLDYTRTRLGKGIPITATDGDLEDLCNTCLHEVSLGHPQARITFDSSGDFNGQFDGDRMRQVISNLLNNAVQHGKPYEPVRLNAQGDGQGFTLKVTNQGVPIPPEKLEAIFDPLIQVAAEGSGSSVTNLGLGLYIARQIVQAHGGTISAMSSADAGTTFTVKLPRSARSSVGLP
jgi:signal transduction histidine kinase